jgi:hypothetical protein
MLTKDTILGASDLPTEEVPVPEWGGSVFVRTMSGMERDAFEQSIVDSKKRGLVNVRARLAVQVVCDSTGARIFTDTDADALGKKSGKALDRIFDVAQRLSGIGAKDVEELEKN